MELMYKVRDDLATMAQVEVEPKAAGRNITMTLSPLPTNKRKRRFSKAGEEIVKSVGCQGCHVVGERADLLVRIVQLLFGGLLAALDELLRTPGQARTAHGSRRPSRVRTSSQ